jgi:hypothetical protein
MINRTIYKAVILTVVSGALLINSGCSDDPEPVTTQQQESSIVVTVSEAGAPSYALRSARVVDANYRTGSPSMSITGTMSNGKTLLMRFNKSGNAPDYTTNAVDARLDGVVGTSATGITAYSTQTRMVDGSFQATFPSVGVVTGSFAGIALQ